MAMKGQTAREQFDRIYDSYRNNQMKQCYEQIKELGLYQMPHFLKYVEEDLNQPETAIEIACVYFRIESA